MIYVLDASVALKFVLAEELADAARELRKSMIDGSHEFIAPDLFLIEIAHALSKALRQRRITEDEAVAYYKEILLTPPSFYSSLSLLDRAYELALNFRTRVYDCLYVALAEDQGCSLVTADSKATAVFSGFPVMGLAAFQAG